MHYFKALTACAGILLYTGRFSEIRKYPHTNCACDKGQNLQPKTPLFPHGNNWRKCRYQRFPEAAPISASMDAVPARTCTLSDSAPDTVGTGAAKAWVSPHRNLPYVSPHITSVRYPAPSGLFCGMAHARGTSAVLWKPQFSQRHLSGMHTKSTRCSGGMRLSRNAAYGNGWLFRRHGRLAANRH